MRIVLLIITAFAALLSVPASAQDFPALTGRVVDNADLLSPAQESELTAKLAQLEAQSQRQLVVATVPDLQGYDIADYGYRLGREWGLGDAERNDGALLLVAPNERKVRIEVGYGLEGYLTDAFSALIIQNTIIPRFRDDDYPGGIIAGTDAIIAQLELPPDEAQRVTQQAQETRNTDGGFPIGTLIWLGFMFFFFVLPIIRGGARRRKYRKRKKGPWGKRRGKKRDDDDDWFDDDDDDWGRTARDIILWEVGSAVLRGAMRGGGGGGGFGGGGGSFGGGGASGGW